jgi:hypothetical protein
VNFAVTICRLLIALPIWGSCEWIPKMNVKGAFENDYYYAVEKQQSRK